ncbi:recombinase RecT [Rosenbergiella epipactidis]|uniref:recombinase RecT n=1 Tax=Rosenbergiella epipactidis TaxID=1544694 RepID=UPI001F4EB563|nr:recombinase RecT [Rosenbergiella epipactidis]
MANNIIELVQTQESFFNQSLSDQAVNWAKESQFAIQLFQKNDKLAEIGMKNQVSTQNAIINVAAIGITLNPASKLAYLVPRDGMVCLDISYMGLLHLAQSTGSILWGQCKLVHENDTYESNGLDSAPTHKYNAFGDRGSVVGGYCTIKTPEGDYLTEEMSIDEIRQVERSSKSASKGKGPWVVWWDEMARKTIVKRASKYWPRRERLDNAINHLNTEGGEGIVTQNEPRDVSPATDETIQLINDQLLAMNKTWDTDLLPLCSTIFKRSITKPADITEPEAIKTLDFLKKKAAA